VRYHSLFPIVYKSNYPKPAWIRTQSVNKSMLGPILGSFLRIRLAGPDFSQPAGGWPDNIGIMRHYHSTIIIDGAAQSTIGGQLFTPDLTQALHYETQVAWVLDQIKDSQTGQVLLREIMSAPMGRQVRIIPFPLQDARSVPSSETGAAPGGAQLRFPGDLPETAAVEQAGQRRFDAQNNPLLGTGEGANVTIHYHPMTWLLNSFQTGLVANLMPDDVLVHELVHVLRMMSGRVLTMNLSTLDHTRRWGNIEEFYGVLVANIYISERNSTDRRGQPLRGNAGPISQYAALSGEEAKSKNFAKTYRSQIKSLCDEMIGLTHGGGRQGLAGVPADFNPIRDLLAEEDELRAKMYGHGFDIHGLTLSH